MVALRVSRLSKLKDNLSVWFCPICDSSKFGRTWSVWSCQNKNWELGPNYGWRKKEIRSRQKIVPGLIRPGTCKLEPLVKIKL